MKSKFWIVGVLLMGLALSPLAIASADESAPAADNHGASSTDSGHDASSSGSAGGASASSSSHGASGAGAGSLIAPRELQQLDAARHESHASRALIEIPEHSSSIMVWVLAVLLVGAVVVGFQTIRSAFFNGLNIARKLYVGSIALVTVAIFVGMANWYFLNRVSTDSHEAETLLTIEAEIARLTTLQNEFLVVGIGDREAGERLLAELEHLTEAAIMAALEGAEQRQALADLRLILDESEYYNHVLSQIITEQPEVEVDNRHSLTVVADLELTLELLAHEVEATADLAKRDANIIAALGVVMMLIAGWLLTTNTAQRLTDPIYSATKFAKEMALGDFSNSLHVASSDEIGQLREALNQIAESGNERAAAASTIADGNLNVEAKILSEEDVLGRAMATMAESMNNALTQVAGAT